MTDSAESSDVKAPVGWEGNAFDYIPLGPLSPLRIINDMVK